METELLQLFGQEVELLALIPTFFLQLANFGLRGGGKSAGKEEDGQEEQKWGNGQEGNEENQA